MILTCCLIAVTVLGIVALVATATADSQRLGAGAGPGMRVERRTSAALGRMPKMTGPSPEDFPETPIEFNPRGGEVMATLTCGEAQMGTYTLRLWSPDGSTVVTKARGSFVDAEEDVYPLPPPLADNHLRILQCRSRVWLIQGNRKYAVFMTLTQDGSQIGEVSEEDETDEPTVIVDLRARLVGIRL